MGWNASCALFGKLPWAADYVRLNHVQPAALALDAWLQASHQQLALAGAQWPRATLRFVFTDRASATVATGVLAPSRDRAARKFPVALFATYPADSFALRFAHVPAGLAPFYEAAERALTTAAEADREQTAHALARMRAPSLPELDAEEAGPLTATELASSLFEEAPELRLMAAATALARAAWDVRGRPPARAAVLDLPCRSAAHVAPWLALLAPLRAAGDLPPSLFWCAAPDAPRALLALGSPPPSLLLWLAEPSRRTDRLQVLARAPDVSEATRLTCGLGAASSQQSAERFFSQLAASFARAATTRG